MLTLSRKGFSEGSVSYPTGFELSLIHIFTNRTAGRTVTSDRQLIDTIKERLAERNIETYLKEMTALGYSPEQAIDLMKKKGVKETE